MPGISAEKESKNPISKAIAGQSVSNVGKSMPAIPALQKREADEEKLQLKAIQLRGEGEESPIQGKLTVQQKGGFGEEEPLQPFQLKSDTLQNVVDSGENEPLQTQPFQLKNNTSQKVADSSEKLAIQNKSDLVQKKENNTGLPDNLKTGIESLSGFSMSDVKVHYNSDKPAQLQALAYAQGTDIHIGPGQEKHLPHEAWHVAQQKQGRVQPTIQAKGVQINADKSLENEADVMGAKALQTTASSGKYGILHSSIQAPIVQGRWLSAENYISIHKADPATVYNQVRESPLKALVFFAGSDVNIGLLQKAIESNEGSLDVVQQSLLKLYESETVYSNSGLVQALGNIFTPGTSGEEISNEDHPDVSDAPEYAIDPDEDVYKLTLNSKDPQLMQRIFINWLTSKGYKTDETTETKYYQWLYGGVFTRNQFDNLFGSNPTFGSGIISKKVAQLARTPNTLSEQASYVTKNFGPFNNVKYMRDGVGNIAFETTHNAPTIWQNPVKPSSKIDLKTDSKNTRFGIMPSGTKVEIAKASRAQHFAIGDRLLPGNGRGGAWTWHHLSNEYEMVLVDMTVHAKHGHNGGVYLWK